VKKVSKKQFKTPTQQECPHNKNSESYESLGKVLKSSHLKVKKKKNVRKTTIKLHAI